MIEYTHRDSYLLLSMKGGLFLEIIIWAVLFVILVAVEFASVQLISIWFALGALITMLCAYFLDLSFLQQLGIFVVTSAILLAVSFPIARKKLNGKKIATNSELDVGQSAAVIEEINSDLGTGRVTLNGVDWSAVPEDLGTVIPKGSIVTVREVHGAKLVVALKDEKSVHA